MVILEAIQASWKGEQWVESLEVGIFNCFVAEALSKFVMPTAFLEDMPE